MYGEADKEDKKKGIAVLMAIPLFRFFRVRLAEGVGVAWRELKRCGGYGFVGLEVAEECETEVFVG